MRSPSDREPTIGHLLRKRALEDPERTAFSFLHDGDVEPVEIGYGELHRRACGIADELNAAAEPGDRALLLYPPGLDFITAFFGCLYAGIVAVPAYPPHRNPRRARQADARLAALARDADPRLVLTTGRLLEAVAETEAVPAARWLATEPPAADDRPAVDGPRPEVTAEGLAFLQYTSGSTGSPRGVRVSHRNVLHNEEMIRRAFGQSRESVIVGWLPLYHDMGLIGNVLQPIYLGARCLLMTPTAFLRRPVSWLETISSHRATTSGGPDFGYRLCADRIADRDLESLDLSSWRVAFNGAEPVRRSTLERFAERFAPCGFRLEAFYPCYGLAEATLFVTGGGVERPPVTKAVSAAALGRHRVSPAAGGDDARELVASGRSWLDQRVLVADPETGEVCGPERVGEVWVAGPSVADGYWNRPEESARDFQARVPGLEGERFLRTGDLGFLADGELFITGRSKDLIILRGRNHYPQDLEWAAEESHPDLRSGCAAAFSIDEGGEERLVVVVEVERRRRDEVAVPAVAEAVRRAIAELHEAAVHEVVLIAPGTLPKTSSGKVQRHACRERYLEDALEVLGRDARVAAGAEGGPSGETAGTGGAGAGRAALLTLPADQRRPVVEWSLRQRASAILRVPPSRLDPGTPLTALGLDSLAAVELQGAVASELGVGLSLEGLLGGAELGELVSEVLERLDGPEPEVPASASALAAESEPSMEAPLSWGQQGLWWIHGLAPASSAYHIAAAVEVRGELDAGALTAAFETLAARHPALRSTFREAGDGPVQRFDGPAPERVDEEPAPSELDARLRAFAARPFDLEHGPLLRVGVFRPAGRPPVVALAVHHIVADFWSLALLVRELGALYAARVEGRAVAPAAPGAGYRRFVDHQRRLLAGPEGERLWRFWERALAGAPAALELATDRPRPPLQSYRGSAVPVRIDRRTNDAVGAFADGRGASLFATLLAAFAALLHRYGAGRDLVIGAPAANRRAPELAEVVGYLVNPLPLRTEVVPGAGFGALAVRAARGVTAALEHQEFPFPLLVERLGGGRDPSRPPLFQVMLTLQRAPRTGDPALVSLALGEPGTPLALGPLELEAVPIEGGGAQVDLALELGEVAGELRGALRYNLDLFDRTTVRRMSRHLAALLTAAVADPDRPVAELPLLTAAEEQQLLREWRPPRLDPDGARGEAAGCFLRRFESWVERAPGAVALAFEGREMSYRRLDRAADRLARQLRRRGVGRESLVGVCLERGPEMVVALLGILRSGGAYLPLDPSYPRERLAFMAEDAGIGILVTAGDADAGGVLPAELERVPVELGTGEEEESGAAAARPRIDPDQLAYVIYTSGSTGRPKGVQIGHRQLDNFLLSMATEPGLAAGETLLAVTSLSFDIAALELFLPLSTGARVVLASRPTAADGARLRAALEASGATAMQGTPATWQLLLAAGWRGDRRLEALCGGEELPPALAEELGRRCGSLWNLYGPTETTVWSAVERVGSSSIGADRRVAIGRPLRATTLAVLDRRLGLVPVGVPGELLIGGAGLSRGYLGRPGLTAERFLPDPYRERPGARLYRTGDLVRRRRDGRLEFLGRLDHQVKVRGFRIELGEVEAALGADPRVREAVAGTRPDAAGGNLLVAYVVPASGGGAASGDQAELRAGLERRLPAYMVPGIVAILDDLPRTPNRKVDRRALAALPVETSGATAVAPRTDTERWLAELWGELLGRERVGVEDNFFELGGHSLLATRMFSRLRDRHGVELPLQTLFEAPTVAALARRIDRGGRPAATDATPITPVAGAEAPLSYSQERLWFLSQLEGDGSAYGIFGALELRGSLAVPALDAALAAIVRRHGSLRTTFPASRGRAVQRVAPPGGWRLPVIDLGGLPPATAGAHARRLAEEELHRPFDLVRGPLFRAVLLRLAPRRHHLLLNLHHIVSDGWSLAVMLRELEALYPAARARRRSPLPPLPVQYADYAHWQHRRSAEGELTRQLEYWRQRFADGQQVLELPTDRPRPAVQTFRGGRFPWHFPRHRFEAVERYAVEEGATPFMVVLAAFAGVLGALAGQRDVTVGTFIANRNREETEGLIGFFVNNLALRLDLGGDPSFHRLVEGVREVTLGGYAHQDLPFERLLAELKLERTRDRPALFQSMLVFQNLPDLSLRLPELEVRRLPLERGRADFELTLWMDERRGLEPAFEYNADLFDRTTVERLAKRLGDLLARAVEEPERRLSELLAPGPAERHQLLVEWSGRDGVEAPAETVHGLIAARAAAAPDRVALVAGEARLSYGELVRRARRLARRLRALGAGPERFVALYLERSIEALVAVLATLESGAAYVPLDATYGPERLPFIDRESRPVALLTLERLRGELPELAAPVVCLDAPPPIESEEAATAADPGGGPDPDVDNPDAAAYALYTSGSTGRPKGVVVAHRSVVHAYRGWERSYGLGSLEAHLQLASLSFDVFGGDLVRALGSGARLVLCPWELLLDGERLSGLIERERIDAAEMVPVVANNLREHLEATGRRLGNFRLLAVGSDAWSVRELEALRRVAGDRARVVNSYGVTEATIDTTFAERFAAAGEERTVPIGRPFAGNRVYLLDRELRPVATGAAGELMIGGAGVARGYLGRPSATAASYLPDPFAEVPGERLYRTGDRARFLADGNLEFLGRTDRQLKIRGFRVEPGEVRSLLEEHPSVARAVVVGRPDASGQKELVAYLVPAAERPEPVELRDLLAERLPSYMVPSAFAVLEELPLTPSGKVDQRALPAPERIGAGAVSAAPRTQTEEVVAAIWAEVLGIERVGVDSDFFDLGGYSLLATQIIARVREAFGVELPIASLFEGTTVAEMARRIDLAGGADSERIEPVPRDGDLPLSFAQERIWFLTQLEPSLTAYHVPRALRVSGELSVPRLERAYAALIERHEILRTSFPTVEGLPVQRVHPPHPFPLLTVDLGGVPGRRGEARRLTLDLGRRLFDLEHGPLLRGAVLRLAPREHVVVQVEHHLVHDGWTEGILARDLFELYAAEVEGRPPALPELPIQFADFAAWQRRWLQGEVLERQLAYWTEQLAGAPAVLDLPTDRPRPAVQGHRGGEVEMEVDAGRVAALHALARRFGATAFMVALAAFDVLVHRYTGRNDMVLGTGVANRSHRETEGLLGMIINTLPLRLRLDGGLTAGELVERAREVCLGAYQHQDMPFEKLVEVLKPERNLSYAPIFQVMFAFHDTPYRTLRMPGAEVELLEAHNRSSKFDLLVIGVPETRREGTTAPAGEIDPMRFLFEYDAELFDATTIARMMGHFDNLLRAFEEDLDRRIGDLPMLSAAEEHQLLREGQGSEASGDGELRLHRLFEAQVARTPDAEALVVGERRLSYRQLDRRAEELARRLRELGVGVETPVAVCLGRSAELVAALLAVLKAGGYYVPIDPAYPRERQTFTLEDSRAAVLVTESSRLEELPPTAARVLAVDRDDGGEEVAVPVGREATAGNLAYVIYTSGSTGVPKGVAIEHRSAGALVHWARHQFGDEELSGVLAATSVCFDLSIFELFVPLAWGGRVILAENVLELPSLAAASEVTLINTVPSGIAELAAVGGIPDGVRTVNLAGEPFRGALVDRLYDRPRVRRVHNLYGPSEDTTYSTGARLRRGVPVPPIGRPIAGTRCYLLDRRLQPVPRGVHGEIFLAGAGLARGYLRRPAATAERFVPAPRWGAPRGDAPFDPAPGERLYRTGDLARVLPDGELEFLGRRDQQVKVRGFRIELGEIEHALERHPEVAEGAVKVCPDAAGDPRLVAWCAPAAGTPAAGTPAAGTPAGELTERLRPYLLERLPAYMVPSHFVALEALPRTPNGKVDRNALRWSGAETAAGGEAATASRAPRSELERRVAEVWCRLLGRESVGVEENFFDLGAHSLLMVRAWGELRPLFGDRLTLVDLFKYPSISALVSAWAPSARSGSRLEEGRARMAARRSATAPGTAAGDGEAVAIVGMAGRFPKAPDLESFWRNLEVGVEGISFFSDRELLERGVDPEELADPSYVKADAVLEDADRFDAAFFGYSPREAQVMDPQQRLFLECAWQALEDAGLDPGGFPGSVGVFAGVSVNRYWMNLYSSPELLRGREAMQALIGNDKDFLATRVSYQLDLQGPALTVQTACSSSLVAAHLACRQLLAGECDAALVGGVSVNAQQGRGYYFTEGGIGSPDGHCRPFDAAARGTVSGNGLGVVVLKRLSEAVADGDRIRAVIRGSAINNDGANKVGFTAPSVEGQAKVIAEALAAAGVTPEQVSYVEAHGTGTELGDPIEVAALTEVFRDGTDRPGVCALGSVKSNVGHLDAAAGVAGLIKTVLALEHRRIPPSLHFERPNPKLDLERSPFFVADRPRDWPAVDGQPRRAGVSSFGLGGTNAHLVLEEAPEPAPSGPSRPAQLLVWSAADAGTLEGVTDRLAEQLERHPEQPLADIAYTCQVGRRRLKHRRILVCRDHGEAVAALTARDPARLLAATGDRGARAVAFLFPGLGDHYPGMARGLYDTEPVFRASIDRCAEGLRPFLDRDLRQLLWPPEEESTPVRDSGIDLRRLVGRGGPPAAERRELDRTRYAQPAVFAVEVALAELWRSWGIRPEAMIGYSLGEYAAACVAGVFSLDDGLRLVAERARLIDEMPAGAMLAVPLPEAELRPQLEAGLGVAAHHGPEVCVVAGEEAAVAALAAALDGRGVVSRRLATSHAFHTEALAPVAEPMAALFAEVELRPPEIPYLANLTGDWITPEQATDPRFWVRHSLETVRFEEGLRKLGTGSERILLEVGPGQALATAVRQHPATAGRAVVTSLRDARERRPDPEQLLESLGRLWLFGAPVDWQAFAGGEERRRVPLPVYPFAGERYWIEPGRSPAAPGGAPRGLDKQPRIADWFYVPTWRLTAAPTEAEPESEPWLALLDGTGAGRGLVEELAVRGHRVTAAVAGEGGLERRADGTFALHPSRPEGFRALLRELAEEGLAPRRILHLWSLDPAPAGAVEEERFAHAQERGLHSLLALAGALSEQGLGVGVELTAVTRGAWRVDGGEESAPEQATVTGVLRVAPQELPGLRCRAIDLPSSSEEAGERRVASRLLAEVLAPAREPTVALRHHGRFVGAFDRVTLPAVAGTVPGLREKGVYLITGGLGRIGLTLAELLAREARARLVLVGRSPLPPREEWSGWLEEHDGDDPTCRRIRRLQELEALGAEVLVLAADVADETAMAAVVARAEERFGPLHGVIHGAGIVGERTHRLVSQTGHEETSWHFRPKARGVWVLERVLAGRELDFRILLSSISTVIGGLSFCAYAAANAYMNAFAAARSGRGEGPWTSLIWDAWRWQEEVEESGLGARTARLALTPSEGVETFRRLLAIADAPQLVVSTGDLEARIEEWVERPMAEGTGGSGPASALARHARPELPTPYVAPRDDTERAVAEVWQELLGVERIGAHDNFFELGGNSLLATRLISDLRSAFTVELPFELFFERPTVAEQASAIAAHGGAGSEAGATETDGAAGTIAAGGGEDILQQLEELEELSEDEAQALIDGGRE